MARKRQSRCPHSHHQMNSETHRVLHRPRSFLKSWFIANSVLSGFLALCWLLLRSGTKPSRLTYPCQQAAFSAASLAFAAPLIAALVTARRGLAQGMRSPSGVASAMLGVLITLGFWGHTSRAEDLRLAVRTPPRDYQAEVFRVTDCPQQPSGDRFVGLDNLLELMGSHNLKFYQSATPSSLAGPTGIIANDDVVVVKINYQWDERGGTNTDLLRGVIRAIVDHPDTFSGEVIVAENAQFNSVSNFDRSANNAEDQSLSPHDVVVGFQGLGYSVSHYDFTEIRYTTVTEYSDGNMNDGYIIYDYDAQLGGRISYPKFQTADGTRISLRDGIWNPDSSSYDRDNLKFINLPVLKSHSATYGLTGCVKHYMGVATRELSTYSHSAIGNGLLGALIGEIRLADLNILDCIWINANPNNGPWTGYDEATRLDQLVASTDPVAADIWAANEILIPAFINNGFDPPWPSPSADPSDPNSAFRNYIDNSMSWLLDAGFTVTNDMAQIQEYSWDGITPLGIFSDGFESGQTSAWTNEGP